jgi:spore germination cell wall hydrolase CwlJ-like protein
MALRSRAISGKVGEHRSSSVHATIDPHKAQEEEEEQEKKNKRKRTREKEQEKKNKRKRTREKEQEKRTKEKRTKRKHGFPDVERRARRGVELLSRSVGAL